MLARVTGGVYLLYFLTAIGGKLLATQGQPTWGGLVNIVSIALYVAVDCLFYVLFRPVNLGLSLTSLCLGLAGCAVMALKELRPETRLINSLLFFGLFDVVIGVLIWKSAFLPPLLGIVMVLAGIGWLVAQIPSFPAPAAPMVMAFGFVAELALMLWLLLRGTALRGHPL